MGSPKGNRAYATCLQPGPGDAAAVATPILAGGGLAARAGGVRLPSEAPLFSLTDGPRGSSGTDGARASRATPSERRPQGARRVSGDAPHTLWPWSLSTHVHMTGVPTPPDGLCRIGNGTPTDRPTGRITLHPPPTQPSPPSRLPTSTTHPPPCCQTLLTRSERGKSGGPRDDLPNPSVRAKR